MQKNPRLAIIIENLLQQKTFPALIQIAVGELVPFNNEQIHKQWNESPLSQIKLIIRRVPIEQQCMSCFEKYRPSHHEVSCPNCGGAGAKIIAGEEFYYESS